MQAKFWKDRDVQKLRSDADFAYLDGRTQRAKTLNKLADKAANELRMRALREAAAQNNGNWLENERDGAAQ